MKKLKLAIIGAIIIAFAPAALALTELQVSKAWCKQKNGIAEYRLPDRTRIDCLTEFYAGEVEWAKGGKVYQCIGQSLYYARQSDTAPLCIFVKKDKQTYTNFWKYVKRAIIAGGDDVKIICIKEDTTTLRCTEP